MRYLCLAGNLIPFGFFETKIGSDDLVCNGHRLIIFPGQITHKSTEKI
jgi:hypothetical protein